MEINEILRVVLILGGCVNVIGNIIALLGLLQFGQKTPTRIYIIYIVILSLVQQFVSPVFQIFYVTQFPVEFNVNYLLNKTFCVVILGIIVSLTLLLLMDYFQCIKEYKFIIIAVHFALIIFIVTVLHFLITSHQAENLGMFGVIMIPLSFLLFFISHTYIDCLKERKQSDGESAVRLMMVTLYICSKIIAAIVLGLEWFIYIVFLDKHSHYEVGGFAFAISETDSFFFLIALLKYDPNFRSSFVNLKRKFYFAKSKYVELQNQV